MYSIIFSSRKKNNPTYGLNNLLKSFIDNTNNEERCSSEFLIKIDDDDDSIIEDIELFSDILNIKTFIWPQYGGRNSLHEVQYYLYKYKNENTKWIQVIADDFLFTRNNFITDILSINTDYLILGSDKCNDLCHGTAPCFSRKLCDALAGSFGCHSNSDGFAFGLGEIMQKKYNINIISDIKPYYIRTQYHYTSEIHNKFNRITQDHSNLIYELLAKNLYLNILYG